MTYENISEKDSELLKLENRKKIYELVRKNQGCHFREIERRIKIPYGTLKYNLNFLVKHNLLFEKKDKNNIRYYTKELNQDDLKLISLLRQNSIRKIILFLVINKNATYIDVVNFVKLSPSTVSWHLAKLLREKIIGKRKNGKYLTYFLLVDKNEIMKVLISYRESFLDSLVNRVIEAWEME